MFGASPPRLALNFIPGAPEPIGWAKVVLKPENVLLNDHSKATFVVFPFGFTSPFSVALMPVIADAAFVVTVGGPVGPQLLGATPENLIELSLSLFVLCSLTPGWAAWDSNRTLRTSIVRAPGPENSMEVTT